MATQAAGPGLPNYYGERMNDGTVIQTPRPSHQGSRDALLRLPIQQAPQMNPDVISPASPISPADALDVNPRTSAIRSSKRIGGDPGRYIQYPGSDREDDGEYSRHPAHRSHRYERHHPSEYRGPYIEDYYEEEDRPRAYRRPARRQHSRPPLSHANYHNRDRYSRDQTRGSMDSGRYSMEYEPDTPTKPRVHYSYGSEDEEYPREDRYHRPGVGGRGPPRRPHSTEEVMRLPWTMWMNSNAKNRKSRPKHQSNS